MVTLNTAAARNQFLSDVLTAAVKGGINYWADCRNYKWGTDATGVNYASVEIRDKERDMPADWTLLTTDTIEDGIAKLVIHEVIDVAIRNDVKQWSDENDASNIDSDVADTIVQMALFGELVYC